MKTWYCDEAVRSDPAARAQVAQHFSSRREARIRRTRYGAGHVVEFVKGGRHRCGLLLSARPRYFRVLDQGGKETPVAREKIVDISRQMLNPWQPRDATIAALQEINRHRNRLAEPMELQTLWEVTRDSGRRDWSLDELAELYFGESAEGDKRSGLSRALDTGALFARHGAQFEPLDPDAVADHDRSVAEAERRERWIDEAGAWLRSVADGAPTSPPEGAGRAIGLLEQEALFGAESPEAHEAALLMKAAHLHGPEAALGVLVKLGHWDRDENLDLLRHEVPTSFSQEALAEAEQVVDGPPCPRLWLGKVYGFVDREGHCYQAASVRWGLSGYTIGVHFASPAVSRGGRVQAEAAERGASIRLPDQVIPMLPPPVGAQSELTTQRRVPTLSIELRVNRRLEVRGYAVKLRRVRLHEALEPAQLDAAMAEQWRLRKLHEFAELLHRQRREAGALIIPEPTLEVQVRSGEIALDVSDPRAGVSLLQHELTLLAGSLLGEFCMRNQLPAVYCVQDLPSQRLVDGCTSYDPVVCRAQKRLMPRPRLKVQPERHAALGVERLASAEQAMDRYPDLFMHQQLAHFLETGTPLYSAEELEHELLYTTCPRDTVRTIESASRRYWLYRYLERSAGPEVEAAILDRARAGYLVELCETTLWVFVRDRRELKFNPGDRVRGDLMHVSARRGEASISNLRPA